jgi:hypothetical protein
MKRRRILIALWDRTLENVMFVDAQDNWTVGYAVNLIATTLNGAEDKQNPAEYKVEENPAEYRLFDWFHDELPDDILVSQVAKPGIVIAINKNASLRQGESDDESTETVGENQSIGPMFAMLIRRHYLENQDEKAGQRTTRFLASEESKYEPAPLNRYDAFVSFASEDEPLAREIVDGLTQKGLKCFLAHSQIEAGQLWQDEIRDALITSTAVVLLLTPHSVNSQWVMCEVGACWALGKPIVPATMYVNIKTVPEIISVYQCRSIETLSERTALISNVFRLCRGTNPE